jgi:hypothetical protein
MRISVISLIGLNSSAIYCDRWGNNVCFLEAGPNSGSAAIRVCDESTEGRLAVPEFYEGVKVIS